MTFPAQSGSSPNIGRRYITYRWTRLLLKNPICYKVAVLLTCRNILIWIKLTVHIHCKINHVCVAEEIQLSFEHFLFIVDLDG